MRNFLKTVSMLYKNSYINPNIAVMRHILWQFRKITNNFPYKVNFERFEVMVKNKSIADGARCLLNAMGYYDPNNMYFMEELFAKKICGVFFDIGAYIGMYSLIASHQPGVNVYSFEPHPFTFNCLLENISLNKLEKTIRPFQLALSDSNGYVLFSNGRGVSTNKIEEKPLNNLNTIQVGAITGDSFCEKHKAAPDIIKIDVEGRESKVLLGFENTIKNVKIVMVESKSINKIKGILNKQRYFLGPYKLDYRNRVFRGDFNSYEDWVFINAEFKNVLEGFHFSLA